MQLHLDWRGIGVSLFSCTLTMLWTLVIDNMKSYPFRQNDFL